jgi:hypothetical protein
VSLGHARRGLWLLAALVALRCADPYYVSLGGNAAELASDAGMPPPACTPGGDMMLIPGAGCGERPPESDRCESSSQALSVRSDCAARTLLACPPPTISNSGSPDADALDALLGALLRTCGDVPNALRVRFASGCATSFALDVADPDADAGSALVACVSARLASERYACAETVSCGVGEILRVPTSAVNPGWL